MDENKNTPLPDPTPYELDQAQALATIVRDMMKPNGLSLAEALRTAYQCGYMFMLEKNMRELQAEVAESVEKAQAHS